MLSLWYLLPLLAGISATPLDSTSCRTNSECLRKGLPLLKPRRPRSAVPLSARAANDFTTGCTSSVVTHTITTAGTYLVSIAGGAGGSAYTGSTQTVPYSIGGRGAEVNATYTLPIGFTFKISVGCNPNVPKRYGAGGGGGGTFVTNPADSSFLQIAGGGGGAPMRSTNGEAMDAGTTGVSSLGVGSGGNARGTNLGQGGSFGNGGKAGTYYNNGYNGNAGGGAGFFTDGGDGQAGSYGPGLGGKSPVNGYAGGIGSYGGNGGYGGGGGAGDSSGGGGGGAGGGGGGAYDVPGVYYDSSKGQQAFGGGFGGSYLGSSPALQANTATLRPLTTGDGFFSLYYLGQ